MTDINKQNKPTPETIFVGNKHANFPQNLTPEDKIYSHTVRAIPEQGDTFWTGSKWHTITKGSHDCREDVAVFI